MLIRDASGNIHIINRTECKNDKEYYQKIYNLKLNYFKKYKSVIVNFPPKKSENNIIA
jgi:hypothetical protein